eukprot:7949838-Lingulodinium_polyedra.AAC.1
MAATTRLEPPARRHRGQDLRLRQWLLRRLQRRYSWFPDVATRHATTGAHANGVLRQRALEAP